LPLATTYSARINSIKSALFLKISMVGNLERIYKISFQVLSANIHRDVIGPPDAQTLDMPSSEASMYSGSESSDLWAYNVYCNVVFLALAAANPPFLRKTLVRKGFRSIEVW
jgi:hypothetical protein